MRMQRLLCAVLFITTECIATSAWPAPAWAQSADEGAKCGCLIVGLQGKTNVTPENASKAIPAVRDMPVFTGDLLKVAESSRVRLICGEANKEYEWTTGSYGVPCGPGDRGSILIGDRVVDPGGIRGESDLPRLLSPRRTTLLNAHPKIRWTPVANVNKYTVRVRGLNVDWSTRVTSTEAVYPDDAPTLVAGQNYKISILAGGRTSDDEGVSGLEFTIIADGEGAKVKARDREIKSLNVEETSKRLLIAYLYASYRLYAEAIMQLDEASNDPETVRMLAELYLKTLLIDNAEAKYVRVLSLAGENTLGKAVANNKLGQIYEASRTKKDKAIQEYEDALKLYLDLKNWDMVGKLASRLAGLQKH